MAMVVATAAAQRFNRAFKRDVGQDSQSTNGAYRGIWNSQEKTQFYLYKSIHNRIFLTQFINCLKVPQTPSRVAKNIRTA
jgi:hypothetical protein